MIVVDASVILDLLRLAEGSTSTEIALVSGEPLAAPDHMLVETTRVLRRWQLGGAFDAETASEMVIQALDLGIRSYSCGDLIPRAWELRNQFTLDDALYIALAEALPAKLLTSDQKLASQASRFVEIYE
ncbi:MAG TPA: type II toxin-antitoxin system VapC family toxin [Solirubrobacterales bacterium]|nr:type II toxin-antitoxin system VapC family toxin [Solirubrobacterales bacterium]